MPQVVLQGSNGQQHETTPPEVVREYGVRPILVTRLILSGEERTYQLPLHGDQILELGITDLTQLAHTKDSPILFHTYNLSYAVGAVIYHCKCLANACSDICCSFAHLPFPGNYETDRVTFANQQEPY
jgi:hypothetical protein